MFSAVWVLVLCQLLTSSSAQVRVTKRGVPPVSYPPASHLYGDGCVLFRFFVFCFFALYAYS